MIKMRKKKGMGQKPSQLNTVLYSCQANTVFTEGRTLGVAKHPKKKQQQQNGTTRNCRQYKWCPFKTTPIKAWYD